MPDQISAATDEQVAEIDNRETAWPDTDKRLLIARIDTLTAENAALRGDLSTVRTMLGIERASNTNYVSINAMLVVIDSALDRASKEPV